MQDRESNIQLKKELGMVYFHRKNKRRGKEIASMGYGKFNHIRDIFMGCWNPEFAFLCTNHIFLEEDIYFKDANPPFPDELLVFVTQSDCEGDISSKEVAALVTTLETNKGFMENIPFPYIRKTIRGVVCDNGWMNDPEWREEAHRFYLMLKDCAKRGYGIEWF